MICYREGIAATEDTIANMSKSLVEAEFKVQKLKEEIAKEKVICNSYIVHLLNATYMIINRYSFDIIL